METLTATTKVSDAGTVTLPAPHGLKGSTVRVDYSIAPQQTTEPLDDKGWPIDFFEKYAGCITDPRFERLPQGEAEPIPPLA
jgi:hypothetical protein